MIFNLQTFTIVHVIISLIGIGTGFIVFFGLLANRLRNGWTGTFLWSTVLTSVTGFLFPFHGFTPGIGLGILSLIVLAVAIPALYLGHLRGSWRPVFVITSAISFYFNFFVLIAQSFQKIPFLNAIAPTQSAPAFLIAQVIALALFVVLAILAAIRFRGEIVRVSVQRA